MISIFQFQYKLALFHDLKCEYNNYLLIIITYSYYVIEYFS